MLASGRFVLDLRLDMRSFNLRTGAAFALFLTASLCPAQQAAPAAAAPAGAMPMNIAARATPADYQAAVRVGKVTIAADFAGHSVPTPEAVFSNEDFVVFEVAFFGPPGERLNLRAEDFTLKVKGKKAALAAQPYALAFHSLKDPEWEQTVVIEKNNSKTSIGGSGGGGGNDPPPAPPRMPIGTERKMQLRVQKAALPEGDRPLPEAGLIFFSLHGKTSNMQGLELVYSGAAGKATLAMQP
jgi:hypothetical protein